MSAFALSDVVSWARAKESEEERKRALCEDLEVRIGVVVRYRERMVGKRDDDADKIKLRPHEERMWARRIAEIDARIDGLRAELSALQK